MTDAKRRLRGLGALLMALGAGPLLAWLGVPLTAAIGDAWGSLLGWAAIPLALAVAASGLWLLARAPVEPWTLPWGRVLGVEVAVLAALALLTFARDAGGVVGWALADVAARAVGDVAAILVWMVLGVGGTLSAFRWGTDELGAWFERMAQQLDDRDPAEIVKGPGASQGRQADSGADGEASGSADPTGQGQPADGGAPAGQDDARPTAVPAAAADPARRSRKGPPKVHIARGARSKARRVARAKALPQLDLLEERDRAVLDEEGLRRLGERIEEVLAGFGVPVDVVEIEHGPAVTRFGLVPGTFERGGTTRRVKVSRITALKDDLALALSAPSVRIEAPVPGRSLVGVEIPNLETRAVGLSGLLRDKRFRALAKESGLALALGRDVSGAAVVADLGAMPHLLVAGATGSGKSVCLTTLLASLLFQSTPDDLRLVLVDPKRVELGPYRRLPHLVAPVVTEVPEVVGALRWAAAEMDRRYREFAERGARDLRAYNGRLAKGEPKLPKIVIVVDELADLMMQALEDVEPLLTRIAQLARATGIHLVLATQRPSTDVITGLIKANVPARIAFAVSSSIDSRVILDSPGAEALLGRGDMLYQPPDAARPRRLQGALVSDDELGRLIDFWASSPWPAPPRLPPWDDLMPPENPEEALYEQAVAAALAAERISASLLQRRLRIGFGKARGLLERMREEGIVDAQGKVDRGPDPEPPSAPTDSPARDPRDGDGAGQVREEGPEQGAHDDAAPHPDDMDWVDDEFTS